MNANTSPDAPANKALETLPTWALSRAFDQAERVIASVTPDQLTGPTPCMEWDVRRLLSHLVQVARRIEALGKGRSALSVPLVEIPAGEVVGRFPEARQRADRAWADDGALTGSVEVPWGTMPGALVLGGRCRR